MGKFLTKRRIAFADTDAAGIAHFASFFRYMEEAEHEMLRSARLGVLRHAVDGHSVSWPRVAANCDYRSPARFEEVLSVSIWVSKLGKKSAVYSFEFDLDDRRVADGQITAACCVEDSDGNLGAIEIPPSFLAGLKQFEL